MRVKWDQLLHPDIAIKGHYIHIFFLFCIKNQLKPNSFPGDPLVLFQPKKKQQQHLI